MLRRIVEKHGKDICSDARRCEALLNDLCGAYRREINVLVNAVEERVPLDLLAGAGSMPHELLLTRLEKQLESHTGLTLEASRWAVDSWALALGVAADEEIEERERTRAASSAPKAETIQPARSENKTTNQSDSNIDRPDPERQPKTRTQVPTPKPAPPNRQPSKIPSPPAYPPARSQPKAQQVPTTRQLPTQNPTVQTKSGFPIFRGCLIIVFLLAIASAALFLGVPYAIEVMRETQRERNNEPPRFPAR